MSVAACLLLYSLVVLIGGPPLLRRLTSLEHSPRLGVAAWMTAIGSVLVSWAAAAALAIAEAAHHWIHPGPAIAACLAALRGLAAGNAGTALHVALFVLVGLGAVVITFSVGRLLRILVRTRSRTHQHARAVHLVGHRVEGLDVVVIDAAEPAAYCVPGQPHAVVITSAALATLTNRELAAILAHEQAHLRERHPQIVAIARSLAATFPALALMTQGAHQISRLLEMRADDAAAAEHGRGPLLGGLLALTGATPASSGALGAAEIAVIARAERLATTHRVGVGQTVLTAAVIAIIAGGPLATALLAVSGVFMCGI